MKPFDLEAAERGDPIQMEDGRKLEFVAYVPEARLEHRVVVLCPTHETNADTLGITRQQVAKMQRAVDALERQNDAIADKTIRQAVNERLVEIRLLLRDGHLGRKKGTAAIRTRGAQGESGV